MKDKIIHRELGYKVVGTIFDVYNKLGPGHKEKYYERALIVALDESGLKYRNQVPYLLKYEEHVVGRYFLDFLIEDKLVLEIKRSQRFTRQHFNQVAEYLKVAGLELAILATFTSDGVKTRRVLNIINHS